MPGTTNRSGTTQRQFNRRLPSDLVGRVAGYPVVIEFPAMASTPPRTVAVRLGRGHVRFSLGTSDDAVAQQRTAHAIAQLARLFDDLRRGPQRLTHRQTVALSRDVYQLIVDKFEDDPGSPDLPTFTAADCMDATEPWLRDDMFYETSFDEALFADTAKAHEAARASGLPRDPTGRYPILVWMAVFQ